MNYIDNSEDVPGIGVIDPERLQDILSNPELKAKAVGVYEASSPDDKERALSLASNISKNPELIPDVMSKVTQIASSTPSGFSSMGPDGTNARQKFMADYERRRKADNAEMDSKIAELDKGREDARWQDFANHIISGMGQAGMYVAGKDDAAARYRAEEMANAGSNVKAIDAKKAELMKWLKEKQKTGNDEYSMGLKAIDSDFRETLDRAKLGLEDRRVGQGDRKLTAEEQKAADEKAFKEKELEMRDAWHKRHGDGSLSKSDKQLALRDSKWAREDQSLFLNGYQLTPGKRPSVDEAKQARSAQANVEELDQGFTRLLYLYDKYGAKAWPDEVKNEMDALAGDLQISLKGPAQYQLGVIAGPDLAILTRAVPNPADGSFKTMAGITDVGTKLRTTLGRIHDRFNAKAKAFGYEQEADEGPVAPAAGHTVMRIAPSAGMRKFNAKDASGAVTEYTIPASDVARFKKSKPDAVEVK